MDDTVMPVTKVIEPAIAQAVDFVNVGVFAVPVKSIEPVYGRSCVTVYPVILNE